MGLLEAYERVSEVKDVASKAAVKTGLDKTENGARDAFRHALAGILITENLGTGFGYVAAELISLGDLAQFIAGQRTAGATLMDWSNNFAGVDFHRRSGDLRGALDNLYKDITSKSGETLVFGQERPTINEINKSALESYLISKGYHISPSPNPPTSGGVESEFGNPNPSRPSSSPEPSSQEPGYPDVRPDDFQPEPPRPQPANPEPESPEPERPEPEPPRPEPETPEPEQPPVPEEEEEPEPVSAPLTTPIDPGHETPPPPPPDFSRIWNRDPDGTYTTPIDPGHETPPPPLPDFSKIWNRDPGGTYTTPIDPGHETPPPPPPPDLEELFLPDPRIISTSAKRMDRQFDLIKETLKKIESAPKIDLDMFFKPIPVSKYGRFIDIPTQKNFKEFAVVAKIEAALDASEDLDLDAFIGQFLGLLETQPLDRFADDFGGALLDYTLSDFVISIATLESDRSRAILLEAVLDFVA